MSWRNLVVIVAVALLGVAVAMAPVAAEQVTIRWATWGPAHVDQQLLDAFHAAYPNIKVEYTESAYGDHHPKVKLHAAGGEPPDVFAVDGVVLMEFVTAGLLRPIDDLIAKDREIDISQYHPIAMREMEYQGKLWGLPYCSSPLYQVINLTNMEEAGLGRPAMNWDLDTYLTYAKKLTRWEGERNVRWGTRNNLDYTTFWPWVWAFGGDAFGTDGTVFTLGTPQGLAGLQCYKTWYTCTG